MTRIPFRLGLLSAALLCAPLRAEEPGLRELLRDALYTEEVTRDAEAAAKQYEEILSRHDEQRAFAASALFRLAEVRRKQDRKEDAIALYQRLLSRFPEATAEAKFARENLATMGSAPPENAPLANPDRDEADLKRLQALAESSPDQLQDPQAFNIAVQEGRTKIVEYLLSKGADPATPGALAIAAERGHLVLCKLLLQHGKPSPEEAGKALTAAIQNDRLVILAHLLEQGLNPNSPVASSTQVFGSPLTFAVAAGRLKAASLLVDHRADINFMMQSKDRQSFSTPFGTPLHVAVIAKQAGLPMVRLLLERGANPNTALAGTGLTPLHFAASRSGPDSDVIVRELLAKNADPNRKSLVPPLGQNTIDREGQLFPLATPFEVALESDAFAKVAAMLAHGADPDTLDREGVPVLFKAALAPTPELFEMLLKAGANANSTDKEGNPVLQLAIFRKSIEALRRLLEAGADAKSVSKHGSSLSVAAMEQGGWAFTELLLSAGAVPDEDWRKSLFSGADRETRVKLIRQFSFPEVGTRPAISAFQENKEGPADPSFWEILARKGDEAPPPLHRLLWGLLDKQMKPSFYMASGPRGGLRSYKERPNEVRITRQTTDGKSEEQTVDLLSDKPFPDLQWGDILEFGIVRQVESQPAKSPVWSLRKRVAFPVTVEIEGRTRRIEMRGTA